MTIDQVVCEDEALEMFLEGRGCVGKPKMKRMDWSWMDTPEKARGYYERHFPGTIRSDVAKDKTNKGRAFYRAVHKRGWLDLVFPESKNPPGWSFLSTKEDWKEYYDKHHKGKSRSELFKDKEGRGAAFYHAIPEEFRDYVLPSSKNADHADWSHLKTKEDWKEHYERHYKGKSRGQLAKDTQGGGRAFYQVIPQEFRDFVLPPRKTTDWSYLKTKEDWKKYYERHHQGKGRTELMKDTESGGSAFYSAIPKEFRDFVLPPSKTTKKTRWSDLKTKEDWKEYYERHHQGKGRTELMNDTESGGSAFYAAIPREFKDYALPPSKKNDWSFLEGEDAQSTAYNCKRYYAQHFAPVSRGTLAADTEKGGGCFYQKVKKLSKRFGFSMDDVMPRAERREK